VQELVFDSLNVRGLTDDKLEVLISVMKDRGIFAMAIQETWRRGRTPDLLRSIGSRAASIDHLVAARQLRWAGHVARMGSERLPRLVMFSWLQHKRAQGGRFMTWGDRLLRNLNRAGPGVLEALRGGGHGRSPKALREALLTNWVDYAVEHKDAWRTNVVAVAQGGLDGLVPRPRPKRRADRQQQQHQ
jgi:hypothetical protein